MPLYDYRCETCGTVEERVAKPEERELPCYECDGNAKRVWLECPSPDWLSLAQGENASPEAIDRFERMHIQQKEKERKAYEEHGDYGPRPGA